MLTATSSDTTATEKTAFSLVRIMLGLEGLVVFIASLLAFHQVSGNWWLFAGLLLAPDLVIVIYMLNKRLGAIAYNIAHTYSLPIGLVMLAWVTDWQFGIVLAIIWLAHIGMDRSIGYGLKYTSAFNETHLQRATQA